jgi:hypothetical protein
VESLDLRGGRLALRSSALAEDGELSFAGQYASELDVPPSEVLAAYKRVLAGKCKIFDRCLPSIMARNEKAEKTRV